MDQNNYFDQSLVTTSNDMEGYNVTKTYGLVRGIVVRSRSVIGNFAAGIQSIFGGNITIYTELCEKARADAYYIMLQHAVELGANGIIAARYDTTEIAPGITEVLCYGTAVTLEKK